MKPKVILRVVAGIAGAALFMQSVYAMGAESVVAGLGRVGWGFLAILALSGAREAARTLAWMRTIEGPVPLRFPAAFRARLAGEALNTLLPMGMVLGEPTKASHVGCEIPFATAMRALAVEFAFYSGSLVLLFSAGVAAFAAAQAYSIAVQLASAAAITVVAVTLIAAVRSRAATRVASDRRVSLRLKELVFGFGDRHPEHVRPIVALEIAYQILAVAEVYVTLLLINPFRPSLASALVLETVNRGVTMIFKILPLRVGVDEVSSSAFASQLHMGVATGLTLALVRKLRLLCWSAIGLALLARRPRTIAPMVAVREPLALGLVIILLLAGTPVRAVAAQMPAATLDGTVLIADPSGASLVVPGVTLTLTCASGDPRVEISNESGQFHFVAAAAGTCSIVAELQGFTSATTMVVLTPGRATDVTLQLGLDTLHEEVTVSGKADTVSESSVSAHVDRITAAVMQTAPIASERFQDALPLIPGVVRGPDGLLNINGARSNQSGLLFNNANGTDPVTGEDAIELPIDAVSSVQVRGAAYAPEFGLSTGAVTTIETQTGGARWRTTVNDLEPRIRRRGGEFRGIESFTPRVTVGGPIVDGKLSILESAQYEYSQTRVFGLPPFESDTKVQSFESFTAADLTISPRHRFTASTMVSPRKTTFAGLNTFNPQAVTPNVKNHSVLGSGADQMILGDAGVLETRVAVKQFDSTIYASQGMQPMVLAPDVNGGSYFNDQDRTSRRIEWLSTYSFAPLGPAHLLKIGGGARREIFDGVSTNRPVDIVGADGALRQETTFDGSGRLGSQRVAAAAFAQDAWTVSSQLTLQYGLRYDHDSLAGDTNVAPRGSFTLATPDGRTVLRGGVGLFYTPVPLNVASFEQMQTRVVTEFAPGGAPAGSVALPNVLASSLRTPRSLTWNAEVDREWLRNLFVRVGYQQRENRFEPVIDRSVTVDNPAIVLRSDGSSRYREGQLTVRYQLRGSDQIVGSYTRSTAFANLNDYNTYFGNVENPVIRPDERGPLAWDAPHRVLFWSSVSLPYDFAVFPVLDVRTGFPLSNVDVDRNFVGPRNEVGRYPTFVSLDVQITKRFRVFDHNATIGLKVFNVTDHFNPRDYQGNIASANFGGFDNAVGRAFRGKWVFEF